MEAEARTVKVEPLAEDTGVPAAASMLVVLRVRAPLAVDTVMGVWLTVRGLLPAAPTDTEGVPLLPTVAIVVREGLLGLSSDSASLSMFPRAITLPRSMNCINRIQINATVRDTRLYYRRDVGFTIHCQVHCSLHKTFYFF